jgi:hypothetical protein
VTDEPCFEFDIAVSFAGEDRDYVERVVRGLDSDQVKVFFDEDYKTDLWGKDLVEEFTDIYRRRARYVVMFISAAYAEKMWTNVERQSALARAATQLGPYVLPVRLDDTQLDGLLPTVAYLDARVEGLQGIIDAIHKKLRAERVPDRTTYDGRVPTSAQELQRLLSLRPDFWEYWLYAATLRLGLEALEPKFLDYEMGFAKQTGESYHGQDAFDFLRSAPSVAGALAERFNIVMDPCVQSRAFGQPGKPGDPDRIVHMAQRLLDVYEAFMDEAARLLGPSVPDEFGSAQQAAAQFGADPIRQIRRFVDKCVETMNSLPEMLQERSEDAEPMVLSLGITINVEESLIRRFIEGLGEGVKSIH